MGCAPSITVSQSGVVYCRDTDETNSPRHSSFSQQQHIHIRTATTDVTAEAGSSRGGTTTVIYHGRKDRRGTISVEVETQTSRSSFNSMKGIVNEVKLGMMKLNQPTMQVLLVFAKEDTQCDGFQTACEKGGYKCSLVRNHADALETYLEEQHDVVVIDHRNPKTIDAVALCRSLRATKPSEFTIILAVTKKSNNTDKEEPSILPLLNAGFNRRYPENPNAGNCLNELYQLELGEVRSNFKLRTTNCLFSAIDNSREAIEITNENHDIQYVNAAHEDLTGYNFDDLLSQDSGSSPRSDKNKPELMETIYSQLKKGKSWEGLLYCKRKHGDSIPQNVLITPVFGHGGKVRHHVVHKRDLAPSQPPGSGTNVINSEIQNLDKINQDIQTGTGTLIRRQSVARIHSMTIEAPITKVINIINAAQENSPVTVVQALDSVLEILRSSELYSPQLTSQQVRDEDQVTSDLVGGLMSHACFLNKRRLSGPECSGVKNVNLPPPATPPTHLSQAPQEVQKILEGEHMWNFNILQLERLTNHRPLTYLGLKIFSRFNVSSFLGVSEDVLRNWLQVIESNYHSSNPYHNSTHAADVLQSTAYFLQKDRLKNCFEPADQVASLIAAIVHDVNHPGRTNSFLCNAGSELAILYNDTAVLESHHSALAFQLTTREDSCNIFKELDREDYRAIRHSVIDMVLATEMTRHFEHLSKFVNCINKPGTRDGDDNSSMQSGQSTPDAASLTTPENRALIRRMLIKCSDVANPTRPVDLCVAWANRISQEYFNQTDEEKRRGLPVVMPVFDRSSCSIPKSQISFIDYFIMDMFDAWDAFSDTPELMEHLHTNYKYWKEQEDKDRKKKLVEGDKP
ncbi:high affinity cAMP-specific and IBMX-insensitive 3',5'-cyclic phosphodiesterase 8B-like isoform X2 [Apostichopus japonicus]|uniref:high affinity cAMP-specific and IBMX-insensitive 3',5'-cyclic phosphodiesterase 8B-like isoform X2 n=1 Tax=Stichopus japonicus TaxID=307972 RepID=UPI003AB802AE